MKYEEEIANSIVKKHFTNFEYSLEELTDHGSSFVFLIKNKNKNYILRISDKKAAIKNNFLALKILNNSGITPKTIYLGKNGKYNYSIESFLNGKKMIKNIKNLKVLIKYLKKIHNKKNDKCGKLEKTSTSWKNYFFKNHVHPYEQEFKRKVKNSNKYLKLIASNFLKKASNFSLLHGDFSFTNSLFEKNKINFFDFEDSFYGEKEYDLAMIYYMEFLPEKDIIDILSFSEYDKEKILYYALCIGIRKVALAKGKKYFERRLKKLRRIYLNLKNHKLNFSEGVS